MKYVKHILSLVLAFGLLCMASVTAYAHEVPDTSKTGSISVSMTYEGKAVPGGTLTLYWVGKINENDGNYRFTLMTDFAKSGVSLDNISSSELAANLAEYAADNGLSGTTAKIGADGTMTVDGLTLGLYLVVQTKAANGYEAVKPFLVSVPMNENGTYAYDVDAAPKMSTLTETEPTPSTPTTPTTSTTPATPTTPVEPTLPQTGQLNWPVPVLAVFGLLLFSIGWALRFGKGEKPHEA